MLLDNVGHISRFVVNHDFPYVAHIIVDDCPDYCQGFVPIVVISSSKQHLSSLQVPTIGDFINMHHRTFLPWGHTKYQTAADG